MVEVLVLGFKFQVSGWFGSKVESRKLESWKVGSLLLVEGLWLMVEVLVLGFKFQVSSWFGSKVKSWKVGN